MSCLIICLDWFIMLMQQQREHQKSLVFAQSYIRFERQLKIIQKIVTNQLWVGKKTFPSVLIYQISKFVFDNPVKLKECVYSNCISRSIKPNQKCLIKLRNRNASSFMQVKGKSQQRSAFITIYKQWKAMDTSKCSYAQVISKGRLFLSFLSAIKVRMGTQQAVQVDPLVDYQNFQKKEKERGKYFTLVSENKNIVFRQLQEILQYQKDKRINEVVVRSFVSVMAMNMVAVKIDTNYSTQPTGSQGKFLYIENKTQLLLPTVPQKIDKCCPWWLQMIDGEWKLCGSKLGVQLYKEQSYPLKRCRKWLINKRLQYYLQDDVWVFSSE